MQDSLCLQIFRTLDYHNLGCLDQKKVISDLQEMAERNAPYEMYDTPYWHYVLNIRALQTQRVYGKFMLFSYRPEDCLEQYKQICTLQLSPLIKWSTDRNRRWRGDGSKSKIICIYTDRNVPVIKELARWIHDHEMTRKDIPFEAPYEFGSIKEKMMLSELQ